jgi:hypothetical protein
MKIECSSPRPVDSALAEPNYATAKRAWHDQETAVGQLPDRHWSLSAMFDHSILIVTSRNMLPHERTVWSVGGVFTAYCVYHKTGLCAVAACHHHHK